MFIHLIAINKNKNILAKCLKQSMIFLHAKANLATKTKTHYETLGVPPTATYNEIKSAYYELTIKYHPDKNKSESAKEMFQKISDAYDVLSKYHTRKQYDRTIQIKHADMHHTEQKVNKYKPKEKIYRPSTTGKIYDFDEWFRQHYSDTLKLTFKEKKRQEEIRKIKEAVDTSLDLPGFIVVSSVLIVLTLLYQLLKKFIELMTTDPKRSK